MTAARGRRSARTRRLDSAGTATPPRRRWLAWTIVAVVLVGIIAFVPAAIVTDRPAFCVTCHDMQPFYDAWAQGPHKDVWCVDCHVPPGIPNRFLHKFVALQEVYAELATTPSYPKYDAWVPNARCLRCHDGLDTKKVGKFDHKQHRSRGVACATCHASTGHKVTFSSLAAAGILNRANAPAGMTYIGQQFQGTGTGKASVLSGHTPVPCSDCHDQANLQCSFCHTPPARHFGINCRQCHKPDIAFKKTVFSHPSAGEHNFRSRPCAACHPDGTSKVYCTCHKGNPPKGD